MTDDLEPTVTHGQDEPSGARADQNHGSRENELSGPDNFPSAPPILSRGLALRTGPTVPITA
jgi:hypothetical protein